MIKFEAARLHFFSDISYPSPSLLKLPNILFQEYDGSLDSVSVAVTASFNRRGSLLAVGCNDGRIVVWDFLTRGIAKIISAHVHPVTSLR